MVVIDDIFNPMEVSGNNESTNVITFGIIINFQLVFLQFTVGPILVVLAYVNANILV